MAGIMCRLCEHEYNLELIEPPAQPDPLDETEVNIEAFLDCFRGGAPQVVSRRKKK